MHVYLDSADLTDLERVLPNPLVYGITTNPTLMRRAGLTFERVPAFLERAGHLGARAVHVQVRHADTAGMLADARAVQRLRGAMTVVAKLPATRAGLAAAAILAAEGVPVTTTAVYEAEQVLWSVLAGARYAAPYLGRLEDAGRDGLAVIAAMHAVVTSYGQRGDGNDLRLLVASVRSPQAFRDLLALGVGAITVPVALFERLIDHDATLAAERAFLEDATSIGS